MSFTLNIHVHRHKNIQNSQLKCIAEMYS